MTAPTQLAPACAAGAGPAPRVAGIDVSLTGTAVATLGRTIRFPTTGRRRDLLVTRHRRLTHITRNVLEAVGDVHLAVIEGPAHRAGHMAGHHDGAGLWWLIVDGLLDREIPVAVMPPANRAKYATGSGAARKTAVLEAAFNRYRFPFPTDDEADAAILRAAGLDWLGHPEHPVPDTHRSALLGVQWPDLKAVTP